MTENKIMQYSEMVNDFNKNKLKNLYLFYGKENYLKENILNKIINKSLDDASKEYSCKTFYGEKVQVNELFKELQIMPFFTKQKTVILKGTGKLSKTNKEKLVDQLDHWNNQVDSVRFFIIYDEEKPDKNILNIVKQKGNAVNFEAVNRRTIDMWVKARFKRSGKTITEDALFYLKTMTDSNLRKIFNEIEKIDIYTQGKKVIAKEEMLEAIGDSESINIFKMLDDIGDKNLKNAMDGIVMLNRSSMHYLSILAMIHRQVRLIFQAKLLNEEKKDLNTIKKSLKLPDFIIRKLLRQSNKYSFVELFEAYKLLMFADIELKDSGKEPSIVLEDLVFNIINGGEISR